MKPKYITVFLTLKNGERQLVTWCDPNQADTIAEYLRSSGVVPPGVVLMSTLVPDAPYALDHHKEKYTMLHEPEGK